MDEPVTRCCPSHRTWPELSRHLVAAFPTLAPLAVVDNIDRARRVVEDFEVPVRHQLETAELIVRYQLLQLGGELKESARLKPDRRGPRGRPAQVGAQL